MSNDIGNISGDVLRGFIDIMVLRMLKGADSYGYEISKNITALSQNDFTLKDTTLYSAFARLEKAGHVTSYPGTQTSGGRARTYYTLTTNGANYYHQKCSEWQALQQLIPKFILDQNKPTQKNGDEKDGRN